MRALALLLALGCAPVPVPVPPWFVMRHQSDGCLTEIVECEFVKLETETEILEELTP